jgi:hypothetical protein
MKIPGFTAEASLYNARGHYQSVSVRSCVNGGQRVISQLSIDPFPVSQVLELLDDLGSAICRGLCYLAWANCLEGCEGTPENPKGSTNCIICDQNYNACLQRCG